MIRLQRIVLKVSGSGNGSLHLSTVHDQWVRLHAVHSQDLLPLENGFNFVVKHLQLSPQEGVNGTSKRVDEQLARLSIREVKDTPHPRSI